MSSNTSQQGPKSAAKIREKPIVVDVETLLNGGREALILHQGEQYRLRITAKGKLILTK